MSIFSEHLAQPKRLVLAIFLISFLAGSIGGAVFGILGATMLSDTLNGAVVQRLLSGRTGVTSAGTTSDVVDAVQRVEPAVVSIVVTKDVPKLQPVPYNFFDPFGFFAPQQVPPSGGTERQQVGGGSGFFVTADGYIITNKHVVADESADYTVLLNDGKKIPARVIGRDPSNDLAVVKVEGNNYPTVTLGDSNNVVLGETVIAIGNALGEFRNTVSTGVVSGLARSVTASGSAFGTEQLSGVIQTDAAINPGNSGGPLVNIRGEVIGINTAVATQAQNIGFAIPANEVRQVIASVQKHGRIVRPFLGVRYVLVTPELKQANQLSVDYGALVVRGETPTDLAVMPGSPADKAGIRENDIILEIGNEKITSERPLAVLIARYGVGDKVPVTILQNGQQKKVDVQLVERQ